MSNLFRKILKERNTMKGFWCCKLCLMVYKILEKSIFFSNFSIIFKMMEVNKIFSSFKYLKSWAKKVVKKIYRVYWEYLIGFRRYEFRKFRLNFLDLRGKKSVKILINKSSLFDILLAIYFTTGESSS